MLEEEWVSVKTGYPEDQVLVLTYCEYSGMHTLDRREKIIFPSGSEISCWENQRDIDLEITHWKYIYPPFKEKG